MIATVYQIILALLGALAYINGDSWESFAAASFVCGAISSARGK